MVILLVMMINFLQFYIDIMLWKPFLYYWPFVWASGHQWIPLTKASNAELRRRKYRTHICITRPQWCNAILHNLWYWVLINAKDTQPQFVGNGVTSLLHQAINIIYAAIAHLCPASIATLAQRWHWSALSRSAADVAPTLAFRRLRCCGMWAFCRNATVDGT